MLGRVAVSWRNLAAIARVPIDAHEREGGSLIRRLIPWVMLALAAAVIGWLNYYATDDVQVVAAGLLVAGFGFSIWNPRLAWLFVLILWLAIPISGVVADANNYHPGLLKPHPLYESLIALIPVAIGAVVGAGAKWAVGQGRA